MRIYAQPLVISCSWDTVVHWQVSDCCCYMVTLRVETAIAPVHKKYTSSWTQPERYIVFGSEWFGWVSKRAIWDLTTVAPPPRLDTSNVHDAQSSRVDHCHIEINQGRQRYIRWAWVKSTMRPPPIKSFF